MWAAHRLCGRRCRLAARRSRDSLCLCLLCLASRRQREHRLGGRRFRHVARERTLGSLTLAHIRRGRGSRGRGAENPWPLATRFRSVMAERRLVCQTGRSTRRADARARSRTSARGFGTRFWGAGSVETLLTQAWKQPGTRSGDPHRRAQPTSPKSSRRFSRGGVGSNNRTPCGADNNTSNSTTAVTSHVVVGEELRVLKH